MAGIAILRVLSVKHLCTFLLNPHFDLEPDYIIRKPMQHRFQLYILRREILSIFHTRVEYITRHINVGLLADGRNDNACCRTVIWRLLKTAPSPRGMWTSI